jgi:hypothetical protein
MTCYQIQCFMSSGFVNVIFLYNSANDGALSPVPSPLDFLNEYLVLAKINADISSQNYTSNSTVLPYQLCTFAPLKLVSYTFDSRISHRIASSCWIM